MINNTSFFAAGMEHIHRRLQRLYGARANECLARFIMLLGRYGVAPGADVRPAAPDQHDAVLITYGDVLRAPGEPPLRTLKNFADQHLFRAFRTIHILPFFPYSSDDGFSVIHYRTVNPAMGDWPDINGLADNFELMFDLVLNHVSRQSGWFQDYEAGVAPACRYFIEAAPETDLAQVVRPRSLPLLTPVRTRHGEKHLWTTFSADQLDLDFANPDVLFEFLDLLLFYVSMGAAIIRLDAIAYLWKQPGTSCIHLPETHLVVKLFRDLLALTAPHVRLLTETNVPHTENISYFGAGDEARMVYQFALPPLLLHALLNGDATHLTQWAASIAPPPPGCAFLNFTASHDGIGVRPLQDLLPEREIDALTTAVLQRGGQVSTRRAPDGTDIPYELNITYFDALSDPASGDTDLQFARFICAQTIMLELRGIPAVYFNSLLADGNNLEGVRLTGQARTVNRRKFNMDELTAMLADRHAAPARAMQTILRLLRIRSRHAAFHPDGAQRVLDLDPRLFAIIRTAPDDSEKILAISNLAATPADIAVAALTGEGFHPDINQELITGRHVPTDGGRLTLTSGQTFWLRVK